MTEAPRWSLRNAHYLNVKELPDGTRVEWEHKETNTANGRMVRKLFAVPMLLDPAEPADQNYPGEIIVAHAVDGAHNLPQDYIFNGEPTPEMEPLNAEAQAISDSLREKWTHPIESLPGNGAMSDGERQFMQNMMTEFAKQVGASLPQANASVSRAEYDELKAKLDAVLAAQPKPEAPARRV